MFVFLSSFLAHSFHTTKESVNCATGWQQCLWSWKTFHNKLQVSRVGNIGVIKEYSQGM